jgi:hypothetical protein
MKIKTLISSWLVLACMAVSLSFLTGCASTSGSGPKVTEQTIIDSGVALKSLARSTTLLVLEKDIENRKYVNLSIAAIDTLLIGTNYSPGLLVATLRPIFNEINDVKVQIALATASDMYEIYYGRYAREQIRSNDTARILLTAIRDGAQEGTRLRIFRRPDPALTNAPPASP